MFMNIRGRKTKLESFREIVHDRKPDMAGIVETVIKRCNED